MSSSKKSIKELFEEILKLDSYAPSDEVNQLFQQLVAFALSPEMIASELSPDEIRHLQTICAKAEYEMEAHWAQKVLESNDPLQELENFPYYANYEKLTKLEWFSLLSCGNHSSHETLFIGSGPLPLTGIILAREYVENVTLLDIDEKAVAQSKQLISALGLEDKVTIIQGDAKTFSEYNKFNTVFVAALAGALPSDKQEILETIKKETTKQSHIIARSSWGAREILYTPIDKKLFQLFKPLIEVRPHHDVVNSVVIFENEK